MNSSSSTTAGELYLETFPKYRKWINECVICGRRGYKAGTLHLLILRYFEPLEVDDAGVCPDCGGKTNQ